MRRDVWRLCAAAVLLLLLPAGAAAQFEAVVSEVREPNYTHYLNEMLFTHGADSRGPSSPQHDAARDRIRDTLASFGLRVTEEPFTYQGRTYSNVTAVLPGKRSPGDFYVIGAHYDSVNNAGADDDATGIAALLEVARVASLHDFEASLVFVAFDLEEAGLVGSKAWVAAHAGDHIVGVVAMDMIGYNSPGPYHNLLALCVPNAAANPTLAALTAAVARYGAPLTPVYGGISTRSDHAAFASVAPAVAIIEASFSENANYHHATDTVDTAGYIDYGFATAAARSVSGYLAQAAGLLPDDAASVRLGAGGVYNAASFIAGTAAPGAWITLVGSGFGAHPAVSIRDAAGRERAAEVSYASTDQANVLLPAILPAGAATLVLTRDDGGKGELALQVEAVAPGVFTADATGLGAPAAVAVRVTPEGGQTTRNLFRCEPVCSPVAVDFGAEGDRVVLVLYGTGIRGRSNGDAVVVEVAGRIAGAVRGSGAGLRRAGPGQCGAAALASGARPCDGDSACGRPGGKPGGTRSGDAITRLLYPKLGICRGSLRFCSAPSPVTLRPDPTR